MVLAESNEVSWKWRRRGGFWSPVEVVFLVFFLNEVGNTFTCFYYFRKAFNVFFRKTCFCVF